MTYSVLFVDDEPEVCSASQLFLQHSGRLIVTCVSSASAAEELLTKEHFDGIISDYDMPERNGIDLLAAIRRSGYRIPFIILTGRGNKNAAIEALNNGADFYYEKTDSPKGLFEAIEKRLISLIETRQAEMLFHELFSRSPIPIELYSPDGRLIGVNPACLDLFGVVNATEIESFDLFSDPNIPPDQIEKLQRGEGISYTGYFDFDLVRGTNLYSTKKSGKIHISVQITPLYPGYPDIIGGYLAQVQDLSELENAEEAVRQNEANLSTLFNSIPDLIFILDENGIIIDINAQVTERLNYRREELIGKPIVMVHPTLCEQKVKTIISDFSKRESIAHTIPLEDRYGKILYAESRGLWGTWNGKQVIFGITRDITDLKRSEEKFYSAFNISPVLKGLSRADDGRFIEVNDVFLNTLGFTREEVIGKTSKELNLFFDYADRRKILPDSKKDNHRSVEVEIRRKDGSKVFGLFYSDYLQLQEEKLLVVAMVDITDRKQAEIALKESEERYRRIFYNNHSVMMIIDPETAGIIDANPAAAVYYGYSRQELAQMYITEINCLTRDELFNEMERAKAEERNVFVLRHRLASGEIRDVEVHSGPIVIQGRKLLYSIIHDITEKKQIEDALHTANKKLNLLSDLTRHDILNVLTALTGYLEFAGTETSIQDTRLFVEKAQEAAHSIRKHIEFTRDYQDLGTKEPKWQNVREIIKNSAALVGSGAVSIDDTTPERFRILADPLLVKVIYNLIENAIRHGEQVTQISFSLSADENNECTLVIEDDGIGIPSSMKEKIFRKEFGKNTGFGLFLAREILSLTGISIRETGTEGKGARFEIMIPSGVYSLPNSP